MKTLKGSGHVHVYQTVDFGALGEIELRFRVEGSAYYQPAKISGPPEDCYPAEDGGDVHDDSVEIDTDCAPDWIKHLDDQESQLIIDNFLAHKRAECEDALISALIRGELDD